MYYRFTRVYRAGNYLPRAGPHEVFWRLPGVRRIPLDKRHYVNYVFYLLLMGCVIGIALGIGAIAMSWLVSSGTLLKLLDWISSIGYWGNVMMGLLIVLIHFPFMVGYGSLMMASGFLFGFVDGILTTSISCIFGFSIVGGITRFFFKEKARNYIDQNAYVKALIEELIMHKFKFSILIRMTPLPVGIQNIMLALNLNFIFFLISSFIGLTIEQLPLVYVGTTVRKLADIFTGEVDMSPVQFLVLLIPLAGMSVVVGFVLLASRNAFKKVKERQAELENMAAEEGQAAQDLVDVDEAEVNLDLQDEDISNIFEEINIVPMFVSTVSDHIYDNGYSLPDLSSSPILELPPHQVDPSADYGSPIPPSSVQPKLTSVKRRKRGPSLLYLSVANVNQYVRSGKVQEKEKPKIQPPSPSQDPSSASMKRSTSESNLAAVLPVSSGDMVEIDISDKLSKSKVYTSTLILDDQSKRYTWDDSNTQQLVYVDLDGTKKKLEPYFMNPSTEPPPDDAVLTSKKLSNPLQMILEKTNSMRAKRGRTNSELSLLNQESMV